MMNLIDFSGWFGAVLVLYAYYNVSTGKFKSESIQFQFMNISGAAFLIYYTYSCEAYASMVVNIIWVLIGFYSFMKNSPKQNSTIRVNNSFQGGIMKLRAKMILLALCTIGIVSINNSMAQDSEAPQTDDISIESEDTSEVKESDNSEMVIEDTDEAQQSEGLD